MSPETTRDEATRTGMLGVVAASLSLGAAVLHLAVFQDHLADYPPFGIAFAGLAVFQLVTGVGLLGRFRSLPALVVGVNAAAVGVWAMSRTLGLPLGPHPWLAEPVGLADAMATVFAIALISLLLIGVRQRGTVAREAAPVGRLLQVAVVPVVGVVGLMTLVALASLANGGHSHSS